MDGAWLSHFLKVLNQVMDVEWKTQTEDLFALLVELIVHDRASSGSTSRKLGRDVSGN